MNSLKRENGHTKEFRRLVLCSLGKGRREKQKKLRRLVLVEFFLAKGEENERYNTLLFFYERTRFGNQKTQKGFWQRKKKKKKFKRIFKGCVEKLFKMQVKVLLL